MGRVFFGNGAVAVQDSLALPCFGQLQGDFADLLDPAHERLPPLIRQSLDGSMLTFPELGGWLVRSTKNWDQKGRGEHYPTPFLESVDGCRQPRW